MQRLFVLCAAFSGFLAVGMGAFGAHALQTVLPSPRLAAYQTGVLYHLLHTVALLAVAALAPRGDNLALAVAGWGFIAGIGLFSGSLYALSLSGWRLLGAITPLGGLAWLLAWSALAYWAYRLS